jgi:hypothetical protein
MFFAVFFICLTIAIPCFFKGCNLAVTSFCPAKLENFYGHIFNKAIVESECGTRSGHYTCYKPYLYAINQNNNTCAYFINGEAFEHKSDAKKALKKYKIDQHVYWYKKHKSTRCIKKENTIASWYAGIIFFCLAAIALFCSCLCFWRKRQPYRQTDTNDFAIELPNFDFDDDY